MIHSHFCPLMARSWIFVENTEQKRHHTECYSSSVSLSVHLSLALCPSFSVSVCRRLSVSAALLYVCCTVTLTEVSLFFLVLCIALRKCSTPHSAGSGSKGGGNWRRSRSDSLSLSSVLFFSGLSHSFSLSWVLWISTGLWRSSVIAEDITPALILPTCPLIGIQRSQPWLSDNSLHAHIYFLSGTD